MIGLDQLITQGARYKQFDANETIFREGMPCYFYYQLVAGSIKWVNYNDEGDEFIQSIINPGESFGEYPIFDGGLYAATAVAIKDSVVTYLPKTTFLDMLKENPEIHFAFTRLFTERLRFKFLLLKELACYGPEHSLKFMFNHFKETKKNICNTCNQVQLTRQQIANMTGLRVETVIRSIKNLKEKGVLKIEKGKIYY